jgi:hypothetical protein
MSDPCCNDIIGGEIFLTARFPDGGVGHYEGLGDIQIDTSQMRRNDGASSGGSLWVTEVPMPARVIMTFVNRCNSNKRPMRLFHARCRVDVTVVEKSRGLQHDFIGCAIVGMPRQNLSNGEVSGMEIVTDTYVGPTDYSSTGAATGGNDINQGQLAT